MQAASASKPFPTQGRIAARHGDAAAEALLELPAAETKSRSDLEAIPAAIWVTIGLIAQDGFALQVKLKRAARPSERDRVEGTWHAYHAVRGAITVLESIEQPEASAPLVQDVNLLEISNTRPHKAASAIAAVPQVKAVAQAAPRARERESKAPAAGETVAGKLEAAAQVGKEGARRQGVDSDVGSKLAPTLVEIDSSVQDADAAYDFDLD